MDRVFDCWRRIILRYHYLCILECSLVDLVYCLIKNLILKRFCLFLEERWIALHWSDSASPCSILSWALHWRIPGTRKRNLPCSLHQCSIVSALLFSFEKVKLVHTKFPGFLSYCERCLDQRDRNSGSLAYSFGIWALLVASSSSLVLW